MYLLPSMDLESVDETLFVGQSKNTGLCSGDAIIFYSF